MKRIFTTILFIASICIIKPNYLIAQVNTTDSLALVDFYNSTKGAHWIYNTNWLTTAPVSTWVGITVENNRVIEMNFGNNGLNGPIPESFGNLTALKKFSAYYGITGAFPSSIGNLTALQSLSIVFCNGFNGHLPSSIGNLKNLENLYLYSDNITGIIPSSIGNLTNLKMLSLDGSLLKGSIPTSLNNLTNLDTLDLAFNRLSGTIPPLNHLTKLSNLLLLFNSFTFAGMENIVQNFPFAVYAPHQATLTLNKNGNTLSVYASGANALADNTYKWYKGSALVATITGDSTFTPTQNGNYSVAVTNSVATALTLYSDTVYVKTTININDSLALVDLYNNTDGPNWRNHTNWLTTAPVSTWFGIKVTGNRVTSLRLFNNDLKGTLTSSLGNLTAVSELLLTEEANLHGSIPNSIGNLVKLQNLDFTNSGLSGSIPSSIGNLANLKYLQFGINNLSGEIPSTLQKLTTLTILDLDENKLTGNIPASLGNLISLQLCDLSANKLTGSIPEEFGNLANLGTLILRENNLTSSIPSSLGNLVNLTSLDLSFNQLSGKIPKELGNLINLSTLSLQANTLSGDIPGALGKLKNLYVLFLDQNHLSGIIPSTLINLKNVGDYLTLQNNMFTFSGMEKIVTTFPFTNYAPQASIPLHKNNNILSVYASGANALADNTYKWYNGLTLVATITGDSTYQPTQSGNYSVAVTNSVATALTLYSDTVNYSSGDNLIAAQFNNKNLSVSVYPNPATSTAMLSFTADGKYTITVADVSGKILQIKTGIAIKGSTTIQLDVSKYASGMYLITITDEKNRKQSISLNKQ